MVSSGCDACWTYFILEGIMIFNIVVLEEKLFPHTEGILFLASLQFLE